MKHSTANVSASQLRSAAWETCALRVFSVGSVGGDRLSTQGYPTFGTAGVAINASFATMAINPEAGD